MSKGVRNCLAIAVAMGLPAVAIGQQLQGNQNQNNQQQATQQEEQAQAAQRRSAGFRGDASREGWRQEGQGQNQELVNFLAAKLMLANQCQIKVAEMAANQAESEQVKQFANKVKEEHTKVNQQLVSAIPGLRSVQLLASESDRQSATDSLIGERAPGQGQLDRTNDPRRQEAQRQEAQRNQRQQQPQGLPTDRRGAGQYAGAQQGEAFLDGSAQKLLDITRTAAQNNHEAVKQLLSEKQGQEFDKCFVAQEIGAHMWLVAELEAIQNVGPQQFTSVVKEARQTAQTHLETAKQLAANLESQQAQPRGAQPAGAGQFNN